MARTKAKKGLVPFHSIDQLKHFIFPLSHYFGGYQLKRKPQELRTFKKLRWVKGSNN